MKKTLLLAFCFFAPVFAQTRVTPDCVIPFTFTGSGQSTANLTCGHNTLGVASWILVYYNVGFSVVSLTVQSAPDASGTPGSWATFPGTVLSSTQFPGSSGINPNTAITSAFTGFAGYYPWNRVTLSSVTGTGTVKGVLYGFLNSTLAKAGGGSGSGVIIAGTINEISATGLGCSGAAGMCQISIPSSAVFPGNPSTPGSFTTGKGGGTTGALDMVGATSGATSTITVDASNTATTVKLPNDATVGLYAATSPTATPAAGCAQFNGTGTEATSTGTPCGSGTGSAGATLFSTTGSTTATAITATSLIGTVTGSTTIAANTFTAGQYFQVIAQGYYSTPATATSLTINLNIGGTTRLTTGAVAQLAAVTNGTWRLSCGFTTRTAGVSGTQIANCIFEETGPSLTPGESPLQTSSTWSVDTTATQVVDVTATWSTVTGGPTITSTNVVGYIPGAAAAGALTLISKVVTSGSASSVTFSAIPGTYTHLMIIFQARSAASANSDLLCMIVNSDSTSGDYATGQNYAFPGGGGSGNCSVSAGAFIQNLAAANVTAGYSSTGTIAVQNYVATVFDKMFFTSGGFNIVGQTNIGLFSTAMWLSNSAVTSLGFALNSGSSFVDGSTFSLYGVQ